MKNNHIQMRSIIENISEQLAGLKKNDAVANCSQ